MWYSILITALVAYLLGNLNGAVCISNLVAHEDVRNHGSGNAGLTNFIRNYGASKSLGVILVDGGKAALACYTGGLLLAPYGMYLEGMCIGGFAVMLGHIYPILLGFKGGKGILSGAVIAFVIDWRIGLVILGVFAAAYLLTQYVSLGSVLGASTMAILFVVFHFRSPLAAALGVAMGAMAVIMHRANIVRLINGNERKTNLFGKGSKE